MRSAQPWSEDLRTSVLLAVLALALYLPGFWWGLPHATAADRVQSWGVDDGLPLAPLAEMHNILEPKPDRNLGYPLMHSFVVAAAYTPYLLFLWVTGQFQSPSATFPFGLADPIGTLKTLTLIGRLCSVLMAVGIVVAAYDAARVLWERRTAILAALFSMALFPMFYYARTGNVDVPVLFFTALALAVFARCIARGFTAHRAAWLGVWVGFAAATKETSAASFLALPFVLLLLFWREHPRVVGAGAWDFWKPPLVAATAAFLSFGLGSGLFVDHDRFFAHIEFITSRVDTLASGGIAFVPHYPHTWEGNLALARLLGGYLADTMTLPGLLLGLLGLVWVLRRELLVATFALPAATYFLVLFWSARAGLLRYVLPIAFTLAFFAARAVVRGWDSRQPLVRYALAAIAAATFSIASLQGIDLTHSMLNDSRYAAGEWLAENAKSGDRLEYFGPAQKLPPLRADLIAERAIGYYGAVVPPRLDSTAVREIVAGWSERRPAFVLIMPDHSSRAGIPHSATCPPEVYRDLLDGRLGYRLAAFFETPRLFPWLSRPALDYPTVNPPIRVFARVADTAPAAASSLEAPARQEVAR